MKKKIVVSFTTLTSVTTLVIFAATSTSVTSIVAGLVLIEIPIAAIVPFFSLFGHEVILEMKSIYNISKKDEIKVIK